ncbi:hypothetical protein ACCO45_006165 [Purpureocillium lilacinum]|uniref:Uncharacterized protein n=1 Tax=Purpureocillium lilacinum TaxID=33203 RepID=A0ACC4DY92_PURLI
MNRRSERGARDFVPRKSRSHRSPSTPSIHERSTSHDRSTSAGTSTLAMNPSPSAHTRLHRPSVAAPRPPPAPESAPSATVAHPAPALLALRKPVQRRSSRHPAARSVVIATVIADAPQW